jgi:hypothetical protein
MKAFECTTLPEIYAFIDQHIDSKACGSLLLLLLPSGNNKE